MVAAQLSKRNRHTEYKPAWHIPQDSIIVFYYQHNSPQDIFPTVQQVRYRILGKPQPKADRAMQRIDTTHTHMRHLPGKYPGIRVNMLNQQIFHQFPIINLFKSKSRTLRQLKETQRHPVGINQRNHYRLVICILACHAYMSLVKMQWVQAI